MCGKCQLSPHVIVLATRTCHSHVSIAYRDTTDTSPGVRDTRDETRVSILLHDSADNGTRLSGNHGTLGSPDAARWSVVAERALYTILYTEERGDNWRSGQTPVAVLTDSAQWLIRHMSHS